jgi:hypothetical protein
MMRFGCGAHAVHGHGGSQGGHAGHGGSAGHAGHGAARKRLRRCVTSSAGMQSSRPPDAPARSSMAVQL